MTPKAIGDWVTNPIGPECVGGSTTTSSDMVGGDGGTECPQVLRREWGRQRSCCSKGWKSRPRRCAAGRSIYGRYKRCNTDRRLLRFLPMAHPCPSQMAMTPETRSVTYVIDPDASVTRLARSRPRHPALPCCVYHGLLRCKRQSTGKWCCIYTSL